MSFRDVLNQNTKTPSQIQSENELEESERIKSLAKTTYEHIKEQILKKATNGEYSQTNKNRLITIDYSGYETAGFVTQSQISTFINKTFFNPRGEYATFQCYNIVNQNSYNLFISEIRKLADIDEIKITPILTDPRNKKSMIIEIPCQMRGYDNYIFGLRCSIVY